MPQDKIRIAELFAGVGGFRVGFENANTELDDDVFDTIWANQWEPPGKESKQFAWRCYESHFGEGSCSNEDITKVMDEVEADKRQLPDVDMVVGGFPCFIAGTPVLTETGYKPIELIQVGDKVVTHKGRLREVIRTGATAHAETIRITALGNRPIECTPNHPFLASHRSWSFPYGIGGKQKRIPVFSECEWVQAIELEEYDSYLFSPDIADSETNPLDLTMEECWILGRYVADGHTDQNKRSGRKNSYNHKVILSIGAAKVEEAKTHFGQYHATIHPHSQSVFRFIITSQRLCSLIDILDLGHGAINKNIPLSIVRLPKCLLLSFLDGFLSGDGSCHLSKTGKEEWSITTISSKLADSLSLAVQMAYGTHTSIVFCKRPATATISGRIVNQHDTYTIRFRKQPDDYAHKHVKRIENGYIFPIRKIEEANHDITVYNLEVADDHSYLVGLFAVHNCQPFSIARTLSQSTGLSGDKGTKGVLWFEIYRFLQAKHPRYCLFENVDRLLKSPASCRGRDFATILSCLATEGYTVQWRVVDSSEYGSPQRRKRVFIFAEKLNETLDEHGMLEIMNGGILARALPHNKVSADSLTHVALDEYPYAESREFVPLGNGKTPFGNCGIMSCFSVVSCDVEPRYEGVRKTLGDILIDEESIPETYYVSEDSLKRWEYLKGSKRERRMTKDGHEWWYSEGAMAFPDLLTNPSRTILTSEGGTSPSRMKHIIEVGGRWRRLIPEELEALQGFPSGWTDGCGMTDNQRAFCMGNALVTNIPKMIGIELVREISTAANGRGDEQS